MVVFNRAWDAHLRAISAQQPFGESWPFKCSETDTVRPIAAGEFGGCDLFRTSQRSALFAYLNVLFVLGNRYWQAKDQQAHAAQEWQLGKVLEALTPVNGIPQFVLDQFVFPGPERCEYQPLPLPLRVLGQSKRDAASVRRGRHTLPHIVLGWQVARSVPVQDEHQAVLAGGNIESGHDVGGQVGHQPILLQGRTGLASQPQPGARDGQAQNHYSVCPDWLVTRPRPGFHSSPMVPH